MEIYKSKLIKELVEKMDGTTEFRELCEIYDSAVKELSYVYEQNIDRITREKENSTI